MKKVILLMSMLVLITSCGNDDSSNTPPTDDDPAEMFRATLTFTQNWGGTEVTNQDYGKTVFTNENGEQMTITRLRYLISRVVLINSQGQQFPLADYQLIDLGNPATNTFLPPIDIPAGGYRVAFVYGFNEQDNVSGQYSDLNTVLWNWPEDLGGGYHFMQLDGNYNVDADPSPYNFHNGTAREEPGVFIPNHVTFDNPQLTAVATDVIINIDMDISQWFKDPNLWDLNQMDVELMGNYDAQIMMNQNAQSVFTTQILVDE